MFFLKNKLDLGKSFFFLILILLLVVTFVYGRILDYARFHPDLAFMYYWTHNLSIPDLIKSYNPFTSQLIWYRPTAFITFYWILSHFIDWHDITKFQLISLGLQISLGVTIYWFCQSIFEKDKLTSILASILGIIHPAFFLTVPSLWVYDILGIHFILITATIFCSDLLKSKQSLLYLFIGFVTLLGALTSREQAIVLPLFLFLYLLIKYTFKIQKILTLLKDRLFLNRLIFLSISTVFCLGLFLIRKSVLSSYDTEYYRTKLNLGIVLDNLLAEMSLITHTFFHSSKLASLTAYNSVINNLYGIIILLSILTYFIFCFYKKSFKELRNLLVMFGFVATFSLIPVYSGGFFWHYTLPAIGLAIIYAYSVVQLVRKINYKAMQNLALILIISFPVWLSITNFNMQLTVLDDFVGKVASAALFNPPVSEKNIPKNTTIIYENFRNDPWLINPYFFQFVYKRPDLQIIQVADADNLKKEEIKNILSSKNWYYFAVQEQPSVKWLDKTEDFKIMLSRQVGKIDQGKRQKLDL